MSRPPVEADRSSARRRIARTVGGLLLTVVVVAVAVAAVGPAQFVRALARADRGVLAGVGAAAGTVLVLRALALRVVLALLGRPIALGRGLLLYPAVALVNAVMPSGSAGGTPVTALLVARTADAEYEVGLAATLTVTTLNNVAVGVLGFLGVGVLVLTAAPGDDVLLPAAVGTALLVVGVGAAVVAWRHRGGLADLAVDLAVAVLEGIGRVTPWTPPEREAVERHVDRFVVSVWRVSHGGPRPLLVLGGLIAAAHVASVAAFWLSFLAVGVTVPYLVLLAVIPTAVVAAVVPLPGGGGGVEVALVALVSAATTGVPPATVGAAVVVYRTTTYALRVVVGGVSAAALSLSA